MSERIEAGDPLPDDSTSRETERLLDRLRAKGFRVGGTQAVFGLGESPRKVRHVVNGEPLDEEQLRALDEGRLRLGDAGRKDDRPRNARRRTTSTTP